MSTTRHLATRERTGTRLARRAVRVPEATVFALLDAGFAAASYVIVLALRYEGGVPSDEWRDLVSFLPLALTVHLSTSAGFRLHRSIWRFASVQEARRVLLAGATSTAILALISLTIGPRLPVSVLLLGGMMATLLVGANRFRARLFAFHRHTERGAARVLVVGAGDAGAALMRSMLEHTGSGATPIGIVDDDPATWGRCLLGVRIHGGIDAIPELVGRLGADEVLLGIASAGPALVRRVAEATDTAHVPLRVIPSVRELVDGHVAVTDLRDLRVDDLLGRPEVATDLGSARELLRDQIVLITGAGGSIGSEIARQVAVCSPANLVLLDHDETHLYDVTTTLRGPMIEPVLADIRDRRELVELFMAVRPAVVFHAAALKHVPILEDFPCQAAHTNVFGTRNVIDAARACGAKRLVVISTDKAVKPSSVMGASKWVAERLVLAEHGSALSSCAVRFGNVLGSRGSVTPTFALQIASGGPVTVTDARMTRYFMSIEEAAQLVLVAAAMGDSQDIYMLDMGDPISIVDLAEKMIRLSGRRVGTDVELRVVGTRPGEKLHEELCTPDEDTEPTMHPSIQRLCSPVVSSAALRGLLQQLEHLASTRRADELARLLLETANGWAQPVEDTLIDLRDPFAVGGSGTR